MNLIVIGTNHKYSPIDLRERLSFSKKRLGDALSMLKERGVLKGAVILSTCNRIEIYAGTDDPESGTREIEDFICRYHEINKRVLLPYLYIYEDEEALKHLFQVACGLDSMILGETQVSGQVRSSFLEAGNADFIDKFLDEIFYSAISFAKKIQRVTKLSEGKSSVGSVAIDFIKERVGKLSGKNILIIGTGKVTELVLEYLSREKPNVVFISNRTFEKAKKMAYQIGAQAVRFDNLKEYLKKADILITATASPHVIIKKETLTDHRQQTTDHPPTLKLPPSLKLRRTGRGTGRPQTTDHRLIILDLALPRDVDPHVREIENIELFGLEDLKTVIDENMKRKAQEAEKVRRLINIEVDKLWPKFIELEQERALLP